MNDSLPRLKGTVRMLHAAAGAPNVDIYSNGNPIAMNLAFGKATDYKDFSPGKNKIQIYTAGTYDNPIYSEDIEIMPNDIVTISIALLESDISLFTLKDGTSTGNPQQSFLRFINLSTNAPLLTLSLPNGDTLFNGVEYLETTGYYNLSPGIYDFLLTATGASALRFFIKQINLRPGSFHTLYIIGLLNNTPRLGSLFLKDGFES
ncbi:DUF4397 domain-containing protein [Clostridium paraputrificum]|uniref:DUF4397 domain-containing protein n=1 Tax=Clostridium TaxID=1485 RepID=UPI003D341E0B